MPPEDAACSVLTELTNEDNDKGAAYQANMAPKNSSQNHFSPFWGPSEAS